LKTWLRFDRFDLWCCAGLGVIDEYLRLSSWWAWYAVYGNAPRGPLDKRTLAQEHISVSDKQNDSPETEPHIVQESRFKLPPSQVGVRVIYH
jgi:hypothetical protein